MISYWKRSKAVVSKITPEQAEGIIETRQPLGLFYFRCQKDRFYVGIDNSTGDAWTEAFTTFRKCRRWFIRAD